MPLHDWTVDQRTVRYAGASLRNKLRLPESHDVLALVLMCERSINELRLSAQQLWLDISTLDEPKGPHCAAAFETKPIPSNTTTKVAVIVVLNILFIASLPLTTATA